MTAHSIVPPYRRRVRRTGHHSSPSSLSFHLYRTTTATNTNTRSSYEGWCESFVSRVWQVMTMTMMMTMRHAGDMGRRVLAAPWWPSQEMILSAVRTTTTTTTSRSVIHPPTPYTNTKTPTSTTPNCSDTKVASTSAGVTHRRYKEEADPPPSPRDDVSHNRTAAHTTASVLLEHCTSVTIRRNPMTLLLLLSLLLVWMMGRVNHHYHHEITTHAANPPWTVFSVRTPRLVWLPFRNRPARAFLGHSFALKPQRNAFQLRGFA